jgi:hypothetical protein
MNGSTLTTSEIDYYLVFLREQPVHRSIIFLLNEPVDSRREAFLWLA